METLVTNVRKCYRDRAINYDDENWPTNHSLKLMRLELVVKKKGDHFFASQEQKFNISEKNFKQGLITYNGLFKSGKKQVRKVLVEGSAGTGKTSLCISISKDWANGELFQEYELLLLLSLHQRKVALASSLSKLIENFALHDIPSIVSHLEEKKGEGILMIADGWDKLGESERQRGSFLHNLLFGDTLSCASVLVTSRPSASATLRSDTCIDRFVEVRGFNKRTLEDYVQSEVQKGDSSHLILEQLGCNPLMESMCKVPFICTVICHSLWHTFERALPPTMTELSTKVILTTMCNYIWKRGISNNILTLSEVDTLPESLLDSWWRLCQLAFEMLTAHKNQIDLSHIMSGIESAGLLELITEGNNVIFHFLHPMFQEYLAALHIVKLSHTSPETRLKTLDAMKSQQFTMFWQYFFGICMEYDQKNILKHAIHLLSTSDLSKSILCQCAFEARDADITSEIIKALMLSSEKSSIHFGDPNTAHACTAILYVIDSMQGLACGLEINFKGCSLDSKVISKLADILVKQSDQLQVKGLDLSNNDLSDNSVANLFHRALNSFQLLEKLFLRNNNISDKSITCIMTALTPSSSQSMIQLDLSCNPLTLAGLQALQNAIKSNSFANIEILFMQGSLTTDANVNIQYFTTFADALLSHCRHLRRLDISGNDFGESVTPELSRVISKLISFKQNFDLCMNKEYMSEVDKKFVAIMQDCVRRKGTIDHTIAHGVIVGPGRSGKNSLMNRLMGEGPPDPHIISPSTGVLESVVKIEVKKMCTVAAAVSNLLWKRLDYDEEALELMMTTAKSHRAPIDVLESTLNIDSNQDGKMIASAVVVVERTSTSALPVSPPRPEPNKILKVAEGSIIPIESSGDETRSRCKINVFTQEKPLDIFKHAVKLRRMDALREHLESSWSLYLTNTGGQMEFQELLPLLVCGPSVFFITFPLDKNLHEHYTVRYQYADGSEKTYSSPSTLMDEILQTLATIAALDCTGPQHDIDLKPKVFFVGTHKDQILPISSIDDTIRNIDNQLQEKVKQTSLYDQGSIQFAIGKEQLMFAVNNLDKSDTDFQKIRSALQQTIERSEEFTIKCPSTWLVFSLVLRAKHKCSQVLSYNECFAIAQDCGISDRTELNNALFFIHTRLGLVRYFCVKDLNTVVVIDPQILFDTITKLIVETFISDYAEVNEIEEFQKRGIFSMKFIEKVSKKSHSDTQLPIKWLLMLLSHLRIAAFFTDYKGDRKCFFPSVLCHALEQQPMERCDSDCPIKLPPHVVIAFKSGFCPRGIPGALIKYLMMNEMKSQTSWELYPSRVFRNRVSFGVGPCDIMLTIQPTHLEVSFDPESDAVDESEVKETCEETFTQLQQAMKDVTKGYRECDYFFTFYCTRPECKFRPHPAEIDWGMKKLKCKIMDRRSRLPINYELWIAQKKTYRPQQGGLSQMLDLELDFENSGVSKHLGQIADSMCIWEGRIAEGLGLTPTDVEAIKTKYPNELTLQTRAALMKWKQNLGSNATYNNLIAIFECAGYQNHADTVRYLIQQSPIEGHSIQDDEIITPSVSHSPLPQLPVFPEVEPISSSIPLPNTTAVLVVKGHQELQERAAEKSVYIKTKHVREAVGESSLDHEYLASQSSSNKRNMNTCNQIPSEQPETSGGKVNISPPCESSQEGQDSQTKSASNVTLQKESDKSDTEVTQPDISGSGQNSESHYDKQETFDSEMGTKLLKVKHKLDGSDKEKQGEIASQFHPHSDCMTRIEDKQIQNGEYASSALLRESSEQNIPNSDNNGSATKDIASIKEDVPSYCTAKTNQPKTVRIMHSYEDQVPNQRSMELILETECTPEISFREYSMPREDTKTQQLTSTSGSSVSDPIQSQPVQPKGEKKHKKAQSAVRICVTHDKYKAKAPDELTFQKGEVLWILLNNHKWNWWYAVSKTTGSEGYIPKNYVKPINSQKWFFNYKIKRAEAIRLLSMHSNPPGTYLIRESESQPGQYALSVRSHNGIIQHYCIWKTSAGTYQLLEPYYFNSLEELMEHYTQAADGLCCQLTLPLKCGYM